MGEKKLSTESIVKNSSTLGVFGVASAPARRLAGSNAPVPSQIRAQSAEIRFFHRSRVKSVRNRPRYEFLNEFPVSDTFAGHTFSTFDLDLDIRHRMTLADLDLDPHT